jgi:D-alanyl-lipoteichoic acid acyltransferase DltB (MBOAT superfamily)
MIFNSYLYLLLFLPIAVLGFQSLRRAPFRVSIGFLVLMSLIYYGWWRPQDLWVIGASCLINFFLGRGIARNRGQSSGRWLLVFGLIVNLGLLAWFKYSGLFEKTLLALTGEGLGIPDIILPLGISFFTFQQVAYLIDSWRGEAEEYHITDYLLFVTFFPQLIAGPIVHHKEMLPQFQRQKGRGVQVIDVSVGVTIIAIGLFKKVVLADNFARVAGPIFDLAATDEARDLTIGEAWAGMLGYTLQIYFDFSGYSDIAIGSARLFGIRLPLNFDSPYKATSLIDFWRRWHMTLSRFLRDYLYIPLGGSRCGTARRYTNLMLTMLLGGFWHGAGWTFILWGALHGLYLCINHGWHHLRNKLRWPSVPRPIALALTFLAVALAWIPFRAGNYELGPQGSTSAALSASWAILESMLGMNGLTFWPPDAGVVVKDSKAIRPIIAGLVVVLFLPSTQQFMRRYTPAIGLAKPSTGNPRRWWKWRPTAVWAIFSLVMLYVVGREFDQLSEFIYFQF